MPTQALISRQAIHIRGESDTVHRSRFVELVTLTFVCGTAVPLLRAQAPPIIRAEAREVLIDVTVTGRKAGSATDLTAKDFSVWEDGKQQKINSVSSAAADPEASQKHFLLYFDFNAMQQEDRVASMKSALGFVDGLASPDRYMAVVSMSPSGPHVLQNFTTAKAALEKAVNVPINSRGQPNIAIDATVSLAAVCDSMAPAAGRKALLLFTGGYPASVDTFRPVITACNRANVAIYVITGAAPVGYSSQTNRPQMNTGMNGSIFNSQNIDPQTGADFARMLAEGTGGEALKVASVLPEQLAAIAREQDEYYRVAYTPPPAKEGSCHTIKVAMAAHGLDARARNEYCTVKPVDLVAGKIAGQELESRAANSGNDGNATLATTVQLPYFYTGTNRASVHLSAEVVPTGMKFEKDKTGLHGQLDVVGTVLRPDGATAARFADTVDIDRENQQSVDAFTRAPYHYEHQFTVAAGTYQFQLAIGAGPNAVGKVEMPLYVEPWNSAKLGMGGIAFSTEAHSVDSAVADEGPALEGRGPLVAGGKRFEAAATNRFPRSAPIYFYTEIYDPALDALTMQYRILDSRTGEVRAETGMAGIGSYMRLGDSVVPFATRLALGQLPAGSYRLEVRAAIAASQETVARTIDFELN
jgi:VWFA-related protein